MVGGTHKDAVRTYKPTATLMQKHVKLLIAFQKSHQDIRYMNRMDPMQAAYRHLVVDAVYAAGGNAGCQQ